MPEDIAVKMGRNSAGGWARKNISRWFISSPSPPPSPGFSSGSTSGSSRGRWALSAGRSRPPPFGGVGGQLASLGGDRRAVGQRNNHPKIREIERPPRLGGGLRPGGSLGCFDLARDPDRLRVFLGIAVGMASSPPRSICRRSRPGGSARALISLYQLMITIGIVLAFLGDTFFASYVKFHGDVGGHWRIMLGILSVRRP